MRVVHVITGLGVGGAEHMLRRLVLADREAGGVEHVVLSLTTVGEVGAMLRAKGVEVQALGMRTAAAAPVALARLAARLRRLAPTIVQTWMYHADLIGGVAARLAGVRRVVWGVRASELVAGVPRTTFAVRRLCATLSGRVPAVIVCAAEHARRVHVALGYDERRMRVIANGFATDVPRARTPAATRMRETLGLAPHEVAVGTVGRFDPFKDYETFARMAGRVRGAHAQVRFVMAGRGLEASNATLIAWLDAAGVRERTLLLGPRTDIADVLPALDVFVLSSRAEGFPNVVGEAMAAALPCVVTDAGDAALLVGATGRVVPPGDDAALAVEVGALIGDEVTRRTLGDAARERLVDEFSMARSRERFRALYHELASA